MTSFAVRPRFSLQSDLEAGQIIQRLEAYSNQVNEQIDTTVVGNHANLRFTEPYQHYWSPHLNLEIIEREEKTVIRGLFGPSPKVWTMFFFFYSGLAFLACIGLLFGGVQWSLNLEPSGFWLMFGALALELVTYLVARTGQNLAEEQMAILRGEFAHILHLWSEMYNTEFVELSRELELAGN